MKGCLAFHAQLSDSWNHFIGKTLFVPSFKVKFLDWCKIIGEGFGSFVAIYFMAFDKRFVNPAE